VYVKGVLVKVEEGVKGGELESGRERRERSERGIGLLIFSSGGVSEE
jgi:hypothetical protein